MLVPKAIPKDVYAPEASYGVTDAVLHNIDAHLTGTHNATLGISDAFCVCLCLFNPSPADGQQHQGGGKVLGWRRLRYLQRTGPDKRHGR